MEKDLEKELNEFVNKHSPTVTDENFGEFINKIALTCAADCPGVFCPRTCIAALSYIIGSLLSQYYDGEKSEEVYALIKQVETIKLSERNSKDKGAT